MAYFGLSVALLSPLGPDGDLDTGRLAAHARDLLARGADGVTPFGTTGEGASFGASERAAGLRGLIEAGIAPGQITVGLFGSSVEEVTTQVRQAQEFGIRDFLLTPPFFFPAPDVAGLYDWHARLFTVTDADTRFVLYHIPQVSGVPLQPELVARLGENFGPRVRGLKDSSGNWQNTLTLLEQGNVPVLVGDERLLHRAMALGAAGSICGMANLHPERMKRIITEHVEDAALSAEVTRVVSGPVTPGIKYLAARAKGDPQWEAVRPPLVPLTSDQKAALLVEAVAEGAVG